MTLIAATRDPVTRPPLWTYAWWLVVGALVSFGFLAGFTIGIPLLLLGVTLAGVGVALPGTRHLGVSALPAGIGLPLLYIAWLNREGPGTICTTATNGVSCSEQWNPWPWVVAAALLVVLSVLLTVVTRVLTPRRRG